MTEEQGYAKRKIEFQDQLLNLNPQQQMPNLQTLWSEIFSDEKYPSTSPAQSLAQIFQNKQVSQGSSNMVQVVDVVNNDGIKEKVAVRISKKNGYFNTGLSDETKKEILNWYTGFDSKNAQKVRMKLRDCAKNRRTTTTTLEQLGEVVENFSNNMPIENGKQLKFLHYISQEIQSYINWNAPYEEKNKKKYSPRIKIYAYKFINFNDKSRLCVIMQAGDLDLSQLYSCRKQNGPKLKFEPNDDAKEKLEAIWHQTTTRLNPNNGEKFLDEIIWQQQDKKNENYSRMDLESSDPNIFNMTQLHVPDYLTSFDVLVAYKIFKAFDSQIDGLELLCTDIKPGNIVIVFKFDAQRKEVVVNFDIFVIDIDSDWCDNIYWTKNATATAKQQFGKPMHKLTTKIFLTNQFFYWPGIKKNIFCQYWVNRSHSRSSLLVSSVNATLCDTNTQLAKDWIRMLIHYQKHTKQKQKNYKEWCESLVSLLTRNIYFLNEADAAVQPLSSPSNTTSNDTSASRKSNIGRKSPAQEGAFAQLYIYACGFFGIGGRRKTRKRKNKSKRGKKKSKRGKKSRRGKKKSKRGKKSRRGKKY